ncbi:putative uroporphyrin-III C-methyltransferase precorrin-2 dehydrogenase sirohydrochlorin ferrochelatase [Rosellinia necatrix]|uniref:precorrin-2 dehydrogenase n=1 Tax=Rosellinia necatrix TaxID=77044 RepID=A0A1W2TIQ3_ROSNE|nr:putative uroporphyrin-III C-methyltransferase precorrin-2 dehydrogenase sirohydrochlorin ferrochelatase [Rosellinia necatrix]
MVSRVALLTAINAESHVHLVVGSNSLAGARCNQSLAAGASPILLAPDGTELHYALQKRVDDGEVKWVKDVFRESHLFSLGREEVGHVVDAVFVTSGSSEGDLSSQISSLCRRNRIPVNVVDNPQLCSFSLLSTHTDGPLQIGVTTNGRGCKLASRIRREIAASLPQNLGHACLRLGQLRSRIQEEDHLSLCVQAGCGDSDDSVDQPATFNRLVTEADLDAAKNRRMRWLGQVCEYWPLKRLAAITDEDVVNILSTYETNGAPEPVAGSIRASQPKNKGRIILAGSGPGHPDLLTRATHKAIQSADLILADKLVPAGVLDLIPRRTPIQIARKFPGNADAAQNELQEMAIAGVKEGKTVLRLKQGDPYIYGRGGEEVEYFRRHGLGDKVVVLPGVTSALSAPLFANIPSTQRDVADQVLICTGTGKKGKPPAPPEYTPSRTVVFLMALHRIAGLVAELTRPLEAESPPPHGDEEKEDLDIVTRQGMNHAAGRRALWPTNTPCAVIERASCPDQRVIRTTLKTVVEAIEQEGSRPPGLLVVGRACEFLNTPTSGCAWTVEDGFNGLDIMDGIDLGST